ncbi:MAG: 2'-5' RNA ligase family protein [Spirochaetia bacterium]
MNEAVRFIIITTPPEDVSRQIDEARRHVCSVSGSRAALAYPPHVTLRTGAMVPAALVPTFIEAFGVVVGRWDPFPIRTEGLWRTAYRDAGKEKYLVGYRIAKDPALAALNERLLAYTTWRASSRLHFEPHLTLAFDDLDLDGFVRVQHWLDDNPKILPDGFRWTCDNVSLFRREPGAWCASRVWKEGREEGSGI